MHVEWYGVCNFVVFSVVEVCVDYAGVYVFVLICVFKKNFVSWVWVLLILLLCSVVIFVFHG